MPAAATTRPYPLGVRLRPDEGGGADVAVYAGHADAVELCLFDDDRPGSPERRFELPDRLHGVWHTHVPDIAPGQRYGFRVHGPWEPEAGSGTTRPSC